MHNPKVASSNLAPATNKIKPGRNFSRLYFLATNGHQIKGCIFSALGFRLAIEQEESAMAQGN
jgi:hypothetical protein